MNIQQEIPMSLFSPGVEAMVEYVLFEDQVEILDKLEIEFEKGIKKVVLQSPCGSGKTVMAAEIIRRALDRNERVVFLAHRRELVFQCAGKLASFEIHHGIIMAGQRPSFYPDVQVGSIQTLTARLNRGRIKLPPADLLILDECHHSLADTHIQLIGRYPDAKVLGLTATPIRGDKVGLRRVYDSMVLGKTIPELVRSGRLVPPEYYAPSAPDLEGLRTIAGDYEKKGLDKRVDIPELVGDIVENWMLRAFDRQTIVFSTSVRHSIHIRDEFRKSGIKAEHIDAKTEPQVRDEILHKLSSGEIQVVCNCQVLTEGWDCPVVSCCVLARPTKSLGLYIQMAGRVLRPCPGKDNAIIMDHAGSYFQHGSVNQDFEWDLEHGRKPKSASSGDSESKEPKDITCGECKFVYKSLRECPKCGWKPETKAKEFAVVDGMLGRIDQEGTFIPTVIAQNSKSEESFYRQMKFHEIEKGFRIGWAGYRFDDKFKKAPPRSYLRLEPEETNPENLRWIKSRKIAYAKGKKAQKEKLAQAQRDREANSG